MIPGTSLQGIAAMATVVGGGLVWFVRASLTKVTIELGICREGLAAHKIETQEKFKEVRDQQQQLRDQSVRQETQMTAILAQLSKLDQIGILVANSESVKATVDRLEGIVVPRQEIEARLRPLEGRHD